MRKLVAVFALIVSASILSVSPLAADAVPAPEALVRNTSRDVLEAIKKENLSPTDKRFTAMVEAKALPNFDFDRMTALAVGKSWRDANNDQQATLVKEFKTLLIRTYSTALTANKIQSIDVKPVKMAEADTDVIVRTEVTVASGQPFPIDYKMLRVGGAWKVYDVSVEGVSLVTNYRTSFNQTVQKSGIDGLIKALQERNAVQTAKAPAAAAAAPAATTAAKQ